MVQQQEKAFDLAQEVTRQLITLATGVITLTITLLTDVLEEDPSGESFLHWAWVLYFFSLAFGIATLMSLTVNLERPGTAESPSVYRAGIRFWSLLQVLTFGAATALTLMFGFRAI